VDWTLARDPLIRSSVLLTFGIPAVVVLAIVAGVVRWRRAGT